MTNSNSSKKKNALYVLGGLLLIASCATVIYLGSMLVKISFSSLAYYLLFFSALMIVASIVSLMHYHKSSKINPDIEKIDTKTNNSLKTLSYIIFWEFHLF